MSRLGFSRTNDIGDADGFLLAAVSYRFGDVGDARSLSRLSSRLGPGDEERLSGHARYHELLPLLHLVAADCASLGHALGLPSSTLRLWEEEYRRETVRSSLVIHGARAALTVLSESGIRAIPLKGVYLSARYYRKPGARPFRDFDLLVREEDLRGLHSALCGAGFRPLEGRPSFVPSPACTVYSLTLEDGITAVEVDVHVGMHWPAEYERRTRFRVSDIWRDARGESWEGIPILAMRPEHLLIVTLLDLAVNHRYARLIKHRDLLEIIDMEAIDWDEVSRCAKRWEVASQVGPGLLYLRHLEPANRVPASVVGELTPGYLAGKLFIRSLPPWNLPAHRSRSFSPANFLFFLLADRPGERLRGLAYIPGHIRRGLRRF